MSFLNRFFELDRRQTNVPTELRGAFTTFLTMAYILAANPMILRAAGVPFESAVACTALAAGVCCILMGLVANFPLALASGMGLNAVVAYQIAGFCRDGVLANGDGIGSSGMASSCFFWCCLDSGNR